MTDRVEQIQQFNDDTAAAQLTPDALAANNAVAEQSLAHAETVRGIAQPIQDHVWALEAERGAYQEHQIRDLNSNSILHEVLIEQTNRQAQPGLGGRPDARAALGVQRRNTPTTRRRDETWDTGSLHRAVGHRNPQQPSTDD